MCRDHRGRHWRTDSGERAVEGGDRGGGLRGGRSAQRDRSRRCLAPQRDEGAARHRRGGKRPQGRGAVTVAGHVQLEDGPGDHQDERQQQAASFGTMGATVHRADLLDVLAGALPVGIVTLGKRCTQVRPDGDLAVARFADGSEIEADVIVGADGIHSAVRTSLFGPDAPRFTGKVCYRSIVPAEVIRGARSSASFGQWLGPHGTIVLYPLRGEELINVVCHYDDDGYRHESWIAECSREEVLARYADWHKSLLRLFAAADTWYKWALYDRDPIPQWTRGRVTVLGDAAHPMLPYLGQGACQAIEDGAVLAAALSAEASDPLTGLARYERTRRPRASRVVLASRERGLSNHLTSRWATWRRDMSIALRRHVNRRDPEGRGAAWLTDYDASSPDVLAA